MILTLFQDGQTCVIITYIALDSPMFFPFISMFRLKATVVTFPWTD